MNLPVMYRVRQRFPSRKLPDLTGALRAELKSIVLPSAKRITVAVGSRGIANLPLIVSEVVAWVRAHGSEPFIVPAMGSHAGATAEGQRRLLEHLGVDAAPIVSSMDVIELGPNIFMDRQAYEADGIIAINRIKPHTSFHGRYESGLMKMLTVGLGKHAGALAIHRHGVRGLREEMPAAAQRVLATGKILAGIALVEDAYDETMLVKALPASQILAVEPELLTVAKVNMPSLPVEELDLLVVDELGKEISGTGMDTNVIGRLGIEGEPEPDSPRIQRIFVRDLVGESAYGIGLADVTTQRLVAQADWNATTINAQTSGFLLRAKLPAVVARDEDVFADVGAVSTPRPATNHGREAAPTATPKIVRIKNTLHLERMLVSEPVLKNIAGRDTIEVLGAATDWLERLTF